MIRGADAPGPALLPWQFPDLDPRAAAPVEDELAVVVTPAPQTEAPTTATDDRPAAEVDAADPSPDLQAASAEIARGYAEGFARGLDEGADKGYADGFAKGVFAAKETLADEARRLASIAERVAAPMPAVERIIEDAVVALALELARAVIRGEIAQTRESLVRLIREALALAPIRADGLRIALNPADLALVHSLAPDIEAGGAALVGDDSIEIGGCLILIDEDDRPVKDRRWHRRSAAEGAAHIDLSLSARWRGAMLALFDGEGT